MKKIDCTPEQWERYKKYSRDWYVRNRDKVRANNRLRFAGKHRERHLRYEYNLTPEDWETMFEAQDRRCAICGRDSPDTKMGWHTDHDHEIGKVRGILCGRCNRIVGYLEAEVAPMAAVYIARGKV